MAFLNDLINLLGGGQKPQAYKAKDGRSVPLPAKAMVQDGQPGGYPAVRSQQQIQASPFKMYEDNSYQGDPRGFQNLNPGYRFYEDNTFSAPQVPIARPSLQRMPGGMVHPQFQQSPNSEGSMLQGRQNWGFIPMQNSGFGGKARFQIGANPQGLPEERYPY